MLASLSRVSDRTRAAVAVEAMKANVMFADADLRITYVNPSLLRFLSQAESELKQELPRFSVNSLIGSNIDIFHKHPSYQRNMLAKLENAHTATIRVGKHAFDLIVSPLLVGRKRIGFVVEWADANARLLAAEFNAQVEAVGRSEAIVEFTPEGIILGANDNFVRCLGYELTEVVGKHHAIFLQPGEAETPEYQAFWTALGRGQFQASQYKRVGKNGREVWIQASYNPIRVDGKIIKVVKFATDVTPTMRAVQSVGKALSDLADGDLAQRLSEPLTPELEKLRADFNRAVAQLQDVMRSVSGTAVGIVRGSGEIAQAGDSLSQRTEQQAASLEQTAAALATITAAVRDTSDNVNRAREAVNKTTADAEQSGSVVGKAVAAMDQIEKSSQQVSQIIGVIDEIAFQTNLLALNAGVEAARAGEAGRGFAVVASEVRALAQRSAESAREIKALIASSSQQVDVGVKLVAETGRSLSRIVPQVNDINGVVASISASAQEQATGLGEVSIAVNAMDQVTQQNAALVEQTTAASHALADEAHDLSRLIGRFQLGDQQAGQAPAAPRPATPSRPGPRLTRPSPPLKLVAGNRPTSQPDAKLDARNETWTEF